MTPCPRCNKAISTQEGDTHTCSPKKELDKQSYLLGFTDGREEGVKQGTERGLNIAIVFIQDYKRGINHDLISSGYEDALFDIIDILKRHITQYQETNNV